MNTLQGFEALRRANPRTNAGFVASVDEATDIVVAQIVATPPNVNGGCESTRPRTRHSSPRRRRLRVAAAAMSLAAGAAVAAFLTVASPSAQSAAAAVRQAATTTATAAERSGTAVVRITQDGQPWAGKTVRWNGANVAITEDATPSRPTNRELRVIDGTLYGQDPDGSWLALGNPENIDPGSGTTPDEYLTAVGEDTGGATLRRITGGMTGLTTSRLDDGSTVYHGTVAAGLIAREAAFKEGQPIRVLPFGYVAHDEAADSAAALDTAVTVDADGIVREITVAWGPAHRHGRTRSPTPASAPPHHSSHPRTPDHSGVARRQNHRSPPTAISS